MDMLSLITSWGGQMATLNNYQELSRTYLVQAAEELDQGDLTQASEKAWGAASTILKAVADQRGWEHRKHADLYRVVNRLVAETRDSGLREQFAMAGDLYNNFYEGGMNREHVEQLLPQVVRLVERVEGLLDDG